jgi:hypothetical protein
MHNELRYQAKRHAISEKLSKKKNSASSPPIFHFFNFFVEKNKTQKQQKHIYGDKK